MKNRSNFVTIHELLQYSSRTVTVGFVYDKNRTQNELRRSGNSRARYSTSIDNWPLRIAYRGNDFHGYFNYALNGPS
jgi:hypothetical protein